MTISRKIAVIGVGYVGLTQAACLAQLGHTVTGLDLDERKIATLRAGRIHFFEPGLPELVGSGIDRGLLRFTTDPNEALRDAEIIFICVGTPSGADGSADVTAVLGAARSIVRHALRPYVAVIKSTMPPGAVITEIERVLAQPQHGRSAGALAVNPEFLREGSAVRDFFKPDRVVIGATDARAAGILADLYEPLGAPILTTDPPTAQLVKYASNAFLATKISFINEISRIAESVGATTSVIARGIGLDARIGDRFLDAGLGYGGSCFPKDVRALWALGREHGLHSSLMQAVMEINDRQREVAIAKLNAALGSVRERRIAVFGLAFKPRTDDIREAPAIDLIQRLRELGASVRAHDPQARSVAERVLPASEQLAYCDDPYDASERADAVLIATDWPQFRALDWSAIAERMSGRTIVDGRGLLHGDEMRDLGFDYIEVAS
jgi:UDPglucose 6-dehydrogenase